MRNPSDDPIAPYALNLNYWYTTVCRLIFVVVFEVNFGTIIIYSTLW